jgi:cysteine desulfurase
MLANNETGFILPVREMATIAKQKGIPVLCDVVCAAGKIPFSFANLGADYMTFSSHKFGGLKGSGGIVTNSSAKLSPLIIGGPQEDEKRAGTQNVLGIAASAYALEKWCANLTEDVCCEEGLRKLLKDKINAAYPSVIFIESENHLPQTLNASFVGLNGNLLLTNLDLEGVSCSYGSACASGSLEVSRVMKELGLKFDEARASLRFSFGKATTNDDIEEFGRRLKKVIAKMT